MSSRSSNPCELMCTRLFSWKLFLEPSCFLEIYMTSAFWLCSMAKWQVYFHISGLYWKLEFDFNKLLSFFTNIEAASPTTVLRKDTDYFLVGHPAHSISGSKLPTARAVLKNFFHKRLLSRSDQCLQGYCWWCSTVLGHGPHLNSGSGNPWGCWSLPHVR